MAKGVRVSQGLARPLGVLLFSVGLLLGMALFGAIVWADFEAVLFDPGLQQDAPLRSLRCPVMIARSETGSVTASLSNPLDRSTERYVRAHITDGYITLMREVNRSVSLAPGERQRLEWEVTGDDAAFERFILVKVILRGRYPLPSRQGTCGILVVDVPYLTGEQVFGLAFGASLLCMIGGLVLWTRASQPLGQRERQAARAMGVLAAGVLLGTTVGLVGWWLPGFIIFLIMLLGIGVMLGHFFGGAGGEPIS
jgi:hypothetical protein